MLKGEDLYIKSGMMGLMTDNVQGAMFDEYKIDHVDCFVDPFDPEKVKQYKVRTNRFHETYKNDINLVWEQSPDSTNPWVYKESYKSKKMALFRKPEDDEKLRPALLFKQNFDIGSMAFQVLFTKAESVLFTYFYYSSVKDTFILSLSPYKLKVTHVENNVPTVLISAKMKILFNSWT